MKQTAVEWLKFQINSIQFQDPAAEELYLEIQPLIEQAKEMEKEKMCKFAYKCHNHYKVYGDFKIEEYYNETFKQQEL